MLTALVSVHSDSSPTVTPGDTLTKGLPSASTLRMHGARQGCAKDWSNRPLPWGEQQAHPINSILFPEGSCSSAVKTTTAPCSIVLSLRRGFASIQVSQ